ncbi:heat shock protein beta-1-like [Pollicipes pollicipes]|uniref:heat shock protein beta-1-like n=1 Tax=Pollicipes pollicipes TaxID=41117 RepID=UPI0018851F20|nr:heat shock protein beta-1-like [Pollicipes pollicipes]
MRHWDPWSGLAESEGCTWSPHVHGPHRALKRHLRQALEPTATKRLCRHEEKQRPEARGSGWWSTPLGYRPEEVNVRRSGRVVTVRARHKERSAGSFVSSKMVRKVTLPESVRADDLTWRHSRSGQLVLEAPAVDPLALEAKTVKVTYDDLDSCVVEDKQIEVPAARSEERDAEAAVDADCRCFERVL